MWHERSTMWRNSNTTLRVRRCRGSSLELENSTTRWVSANCGHCRNLQIFSIVPSAGMVVFWQNPTLVTVSTNEPVVTCTYMSVLQHYFLLLRTMRGGATRQDHRAETSWHAARECFASLQTCLCKRLPDMQTLPIILGPERLPTNTFLGSLYRVALASLVSRLIQKRGTILHGMLTTMRAAAQTNKVQFTLNACK